MVNHVRYAYPIWIGIGVHLIAIKPLKLRLLEESRGTNDSASFRFIDPPR